MQDTGQLGGFIRGDDGLSFQVMQPKIDRIPTGAPGGSRRRERRRLHRRRPRHQQCLDVRPAEAARGSEDLGAASGRSARRSHSSGARDASSSVSRAGHPVRRRRQRRRTTSTCCSPTTRGCCGSGASGWPRRSKTCPSSRASTTSSSRASRSRWRSIARRRGGWASRWPTVTQTLNNAFGQRQVSTIYNALDQYRVVMEVAPELAQGPEALDRMYVHRDGGQRVPLSAFSGYERTVGRRSRQSTGASSRRPAISFELKPGVSLSQAKTSIDRRGRAAGDAVRRFRDAGGQRAAVRDDAGQPAARDHRHAAHRLHRAGRAVRELHAPADDPLDAAVGRRRRAAGAAHRSIRSSV